MSLGCGNPATLGRIRFSENTEQNWLYIYNMRNAIFHILSMHGKNAEFVQHFTSSLSISQNTQNKSVRMLRISRKHTKFEMKTTLGGYSAAKMGSFGQNQLITNIQCKCTSKNLWHQHWGSTFTKSPVFYVKIVSSVHNFSATLQQYIYKIAKFKHTRIFKSAALSLALYSGLRYKNTIAVSRRSPPEDIGHIPAS
jgi:hypothetical protein